MLAARIFAFRSTFDRVLYPTLRMFHAGTPPRVDENPIRIYFTYSKAAAEDKVETLAREGESLL